MPDTPSSPPPSIESVPATLLPGIVRHLLWPPWRPLIVDDFRTWRGFELYVGAVNLSAELAHQTDRPRIGIMLPTSGLFPLALIAVWLLGRTGVPVNYLLKPEERDYVFADAELDVVITASAMLERFGPLPPSVRAIELDRMHFSPVPKLRRLPRVDPAATAVLIYTSGTSGRPKGVELTAYNLSANVEQCRIAGDATSRDTFLGVLPQFHSFGLTVLTLLPLAVGARVIYTARFVPRTIFELLERHRPTGFVAIPAMYRALLAERLADRDAFRSLRLLISGGEALPLAVREGFRERFDAVINEGYGLTETSPVLNWMRPGEHIAGSVGRALPWVDEKVVDRLGAALPPGQEGEVCARGPNIMKGYFKLPESTAAAFDDGFFHTGDLGRFDGDGNLYLTGRMTDLIIVGGENVYPQEIEDVLNRHAAIVDSAVVGIPDPLRGQIPVAFVQFEPGTVVRGERIRAYCRELLASYKVPRRIIPVDEFPRSPTGKILKRLLVVDGTTDSGASQPDQSP